MLVLCIFQFDLRAWIYFTFTKMETLMHTALWLVRSLELANQSAVNVKQTRISPLVLNHGQVVYHRFLLPFVIHYLLCIKRLVYDITKLNYKRHVTKLTTHLSSHNVQLKIRNFKIGNCQINHHDSTFRQLIVFLSCVECSQFFNLYGN